MPAVAALAAFSHHLMVTAMMLPILMRLARDQKLSASRLLMPMSLAASLGLAPQSFVVCSALGAVAAFLTPLGHHGNLLILNPSRYSFGDFLRIGVPLTLLIGAVSAALAHIIWFGPIPPLFGA